MSEQIEHALGRLLTIGTRTTTALLAAGLFATFAFPSTRATKALLTTGIIVLLATPVARVIVSVVGYARERDWWFVLCTAIVLALLVSSFVAAFA